MARLKNLTERGQETQRHLRDVLLQLILEKGYEAVTIKDITERAEVDRTTFYLHFQDKNDLFLKTQQWLVDDLIAQRHQRSGPFPGLVLVFEHIAQHSAQYQVFLQLEGGATLLHEHIVQNTRPILEQLFAEHGLKPEVEIDFLVHFLMGALRSTGRWWLQTGMSTSPAEMAQQFLQLALFGLQTFKKE